MKSRCVIAAATSAASVLCPALTNIARAQPIALSTPQITDDHGHEHGPGHSHEHEFHLLPPGLDANLLEGWGEKWLHSDYSRKGTPFVHLFLSEPAYIDSGFLFDFTFTDGDEGQEYEAAAEFEFALTRRIGIVFEAPYLFLDSDEDGSENGFGDIAIAPRILLLDDDRFLLSANIAFEFPTGNEDRGLGAGEGVFNPSLSTWIDLGNNFTLQANLGIEHGFSSDADALTWGAAIAHSIYLKGEPEIIQANGAVRSHFPVGTLSLIAEIRGEHPLDGPDKGAGTATMVLGASYTVAPALDLRAGLLLPAWKPREFEYGTFFGIVYHF